MIQIRAAAIDCERALLGSLGGGCQVPLERMLRSAGTGCICMAMVGRPDGSQILREQADGTDGVKARPRNSAELLLWRGGDKILNDVYAQEVEVPKQP